MAGELERWLDVAVSKIVSPEKKKEARNDLQKQIEELLETYGDTASVLRELDNAEIAAESLKVKYELPDVTKKYKKLGCILVLLGSLLMIYPVSAWIRLSDETSFAYGGMVNFSTELATGKGIGAGFGCAIIFLILGIVLLWKSRE